MFRQIIFTVLFLFFYAQLSLGQKTVLLSLEFVDGVFEYTTEKPEIGQYRITAMLNGEKEIIVSPFDDPLDPSIMGEITFNKKVELVQFEIEAPGYQNYIEGTLVESIQDDVFSFGSIELVPNDFPIISNVVYSFNDSLEILEVYFNNPYLIRTTFDAILMDFYFYVNMKAKGSNSNPIPEKSFVFNDKIELNNNQIELIYSDSDNKFDSKYKLSGEIEVYPTKDLITMKYDIATYFDIGENSSFKINLALPRKFDFPEEKEFIEYINSLSDSIAIKNITNLGNVRSIQLTFRSNELKNQCSYEWVK